MWLYKTQGLIVICSIDTDDTYYSLDERTLAVHKNVMN